MTLQLQQPRLCLYCNESFNNTGDRGNGGDRTCCHREHSHKYYIFKRRLENLIKQFDLIDNKFEKAQEAGLSELTESTYQFVTGARELIKLGFRADILNEHFQSIIKNKTMTVLPAILQRIEEKKT